MVETTWKKLKETSSRIDKEQILKQAKDSFFKFAYYVLNPYIKYGVTSNTIVCERNKFGEPNSETYDLLYNLYRRKFTGNEAIEKVQNFVDKNGFHILLALDKKLDCGATEKTINKVLIKDYMWRIPTFNVQLAKEVNLEKVSFPVYAEPKYDGVRLLAIKENDVVTLFTRKGREVYLPKLREIIDDIMPNGYVLDGELTEGKGKQESRTSISGKVTSALRNNSVDESTIVYNVFDLLTREEFEKEECKYTYIIRRKRLIPLMNKNEHIKVTKMFRIKDAEQANILFNQYIEQGWEGLVLKQDTKYKYKRSADWVKMKAIKTADLHCIEVIEGTGKYTNMIGALVCEGLVEDKNVLVKVGSGMTEEDRSLDFDNYIGKTIEIKYNTLVKDVEGDYSLFLPRFVCIREDK